jgi:hypothetical protein
MMVSSEANDAALPPEKFIAKIWQERRRFVREGRIKQPHPWQVALSQGTAKRGEEGSNLLLANSSDVADTIAKLCVRVHP